MTLVVGMVNSHMTTLIFRCCDWLQIISELRLVLCSFVAVTRSPYSKMGWLSGYLSYTQSFSSSFFPFFLRVIHQHVQKWWRSPPSQSTFLIFTFISYITSHFFPFRISRQRRGTVRRYNPWQKGLTNLSCLKRTFFTHLWQMWFYEATHYTVHSTVYW